MCASKRLRVFRPGRRHGLLLGHYLSFELMALAHAAEAPRRRDNPSQEDAEQDGRDKCEDQRHRWHLEPQEVKRHRLSVLRPKKDDDRQDDKRGDQSDHAHGSSSVKGLPYAARLRSIRSRDIRRTPVTSFMRSSSRMT